MFDEERVRAGLDRLRARMDFKSSHYRLVQWAGLRQLWEHIPTGERRWIVPDSPSNDWQFPIAIAFHAADPADDYSNKREAICRCAICGYRDVHPVGWLPPFCCGRRMQSLKES